MHQFDEWDLAAWQRKFQGSYAVFDLNGKPETFYVVGVEMHDDNKPCFSIETQHSLRPPKSKVETTYKKPFYYHVKAGWYKDYLLEKVLLIRRLGKQYSVGITGDNAVALTCTEKDILKPQGSQRYPEITQPYQDPFEKVLHEEGVASKNFFFGKQNVYHLDNHVGFRDGHRFMIDDKYRTEIQDIFMNTKLVPEFQ